MKRIADCSHFGNWHTLNEINDFKELVSKAYICAINFPLTDDFYYMQFNFQETHLNVPLDIYFKLCVLLAKDLNNVSDKTYYYSKAKLIYEKKQFSIFRKKFASDYSESKKWFKKGCRPRYKTFYGDSLSYLMRLNLSKKMSSLDESTIDRRNKSISRAMRLNNSGK